MPRAPITARRGFFYNINRNLKQVLPFDWNAVDTELGVMVEQRQEPHVVTFDKTVQLDKLDMAYDSLTEIEEETFQAQYNTAGPATPQDFDY